MYVDQPPCFAEVYVYKRIRDYFCNTRNDFIPVEHVYRWPGTNSLAFTHSSGFGVVCVCCGFATISPPFFNVTILPMIGESFTDMMGSVFPTPFESDIFGFILT